MFRHFPVITGQSPKAAEASQCAAEQGRFWEYHDYLYEQATSLAVAELKSYAGAVGLDTARFNTCLDEGRYADYVEAEERVAIQAGARGTPSFSVNGQLVAAPTYTLLVDAIRAELE